MNESKLITVATSVADAELELVAAAKGGDGRTVTMLTMRYGVEALASDATGKPSRELLEPNVFARSVSQRGSVVPFVSGHWHDNDAYRDPARILARGAEWIDSQDGLRAKVRIVGGPMGDHLLAQIHDGIIGGVSVGYSGIPARTKAVRNNGAPTLYRRQEAILNHVAFVDEGAMPGAIIELVAANARSIKESSIVAMKARLAVIESKYA